MTDVLAEMNSFSKNKLTIPKCCIKINKIAQDLSKGRIWALNKFS